MTGCPDVEKLASRILAGDLESLPLVDLSSEGRAKLIRLLMARPDGRRWLRGSALLTSELAIQLLGWHEDFQQSRPDRSLDAIVESVPLESLDEHALVIASGPAAPALWRRLADDPDKVVRVADQVVRHGEDAAVEATAVHLLLGPSDTYSLGERRRAEIAMIVLATRGGDARGAAAEYLARVAGEELVADLGNLAHDPSPRVRGYVWSAAFRLDRNAAFERAVEILMDESIPVDVRTSALYAAGESFPTEMLVDLLSYVVIHPTEDLALAAADLLHRHHRHPQIAIAAANSPHPEVREIANRLMDPYRGSPAAGGSRPGDPLREDPLLKILRQIEEQDETGK